MSKDNKDTGTIDAFGELMDETQIKSILKSKGWTQKDVAARWGISVVWLSNITQNKKGERSLQHDDAFRGLPSK